MTLTVVQGLGIRLSIGVAFAKEAGTAGLVH